MHFTALSGLRLKPTSAGTLLIGFDPRIALSIARSLDRQGVRVVVATVVDSERPLPSRSVESFYRLCDFTGDPNGFRETLLKIIAAEKVNTVIPVTDRALFALAPHEKMLRKKVRLASPTASQIALILDKAATHRLAVRLEVPSPQTISVNNEAELRALQPRLRFPLYAKLQNKVADCTSIRSSVPDAFRCNDFFELLQWTRVVFPRCPTILLQDNCVGDDVGLAVLMQAGAPRTSYQYRALRLFPSEGGVCTLARSEPVNTRMLGCALRMLAELKWEGIAQFDFRHDPATDQFYLLEINGRFWGSVAAAVASGWDAPLWGWQVARGIPLSVSSYRIGLLSRWLEGDIRRLATITKQKQRERSILIELGHLFLGFRPGVKSMLWSWRDPLPALAVASTAVRLWALTRWQSRKYFRPSPKRASPNLLVRHAKLKKMLHTSSSEAVKRPHTELI